MHLGSALSLFILKHLEKPQGSETASQEPGWHMIDPFYMNHVPLATMAVLKSKLFKKAVLIQGLLILHKCDLVTSRPYDQCIAIVRAYAVDGVQIWEYQLLCYFVLLVIHVLVTDQPAAMAHRCCILAVEHFAKNKIK